MGSITTEHPVNAIKTDDILKNEIAQLNKQLYDAYQKISALTTEVSRLRDVEKLYNKIIKD